MNISQSCLSRLAFKEDVRIKNSNSPERARPTKISVCKAMTPALIRIITISQNGIQIITAHMIPPPIIEWPFGSQSEIH